MAGRALNRQIATALRALSLTLVFTLWAALSGTGVANAQRANPARGALALEVSGLPPLERPAIVVHRRNYSRTRYGLQLSLWALRPGTYTIHVPTLRVLHAAGSVRLGALAHPEKKRIQITVKRGRTTRLTIAYATVVNPGVRRAPSGLLAVRGFATDPTGLVYRDAPPNPVVGQILLAAPSSSLPAGLLARVTSSRRSGGRRLLSVRPAVLQDAVPAFAFEGNVPLQGPAGSASTRAVTGSCDGPKTFNLSTHLDEFNIRNPSAGGWPHPHIAFEIAMRTTESLGVKAAAAGIACTWKLAQIGPLRGAIPTPVGPIPVYATIPVSASASVAGSLSAFTIHAASTSVLSVRLGSGSGLGFWQEGTNVWTDGVLRFTGKAELGAGLDVVLGVGVPTAGNLHVTAGFDAAATWVYGRGCDVGLELGTLSAGAELGPFSFDSPAIGGISIPIWHGCDDNPPPADPGDTSPPGGSGPDPGIGPGPGTGTGTGTGPGTGSGTGPGPGPGGGGETRGFHIQDIFLGGTWARTDPNNGTWYSNGNRPANGAYWYPNGLGVGVDCARTAAGYVVRFADGHQETWSTWFHVTDGKWFPSAAAQEISGNGFNGLPGC